jgi:predicted AAA+ superfamily ATPase
MKNIICDSFKFNTHVNVSIRGNKITLGGPSATGKTVLLKSIEDSDTYKNNATYIELKEYKKDYIAKAFKENIEHLWKDRIILIDDIVNSDKELQELIDGDNSNTYIIAGRNVHLQSLYSYSIAMVESKDGNIGIRYPVELSSTLKGRI